MTIWTDSSKPTERQIKEEKLRRKCRRSLTAFKRVCYRPYRHAAHLDALDRALEQVARYIATGGREGIGRLIVEMPPRHGKSLSTSKLFPTWVLGNHPDWRVMLISYGHTLAHQSSRFARNLIRSPRYQAIFPDVRLADDSAAVDSWDLAGHDGGCDASGIGGGVTGKGAHLLIIDDPIKSRAEAESQTYRDNVWEAYTNDLYTRLEPGGAVVIMMTRWHRDDLVARVLAQAEAGDEDAESWTRLRLPALAEDPNDPLGRQPGEALWPWRFPARRLARIQQAVGRYAWASLYQQRPTPREGGIWKWSDIDRTRVTSHPDLVRVVIGVDPTGGEDGDECGIVVAGLGRDGHGYVLADYSLHASSARWARRVVLAYDEHQADRVVGERNFGGDMVETVLRVVRPHLSYRHVTASRGKEIRAEPVEALYEEGRVHHVGEFAALEDEMTTWKQGSKPSPNRMDALVWTISELMLEGAQEVQIGTAPEILTDWRG